jgi:hypothetical protein
MNTFVSAALCVGEGFLQPALRAEEGGSGHYLPGAIASFVDGAPAAPTFVTRFNGVDSSSSFSGSLPIPGIQPAPVNVKAESYAAGFTFLWRPKFEPAPGLSDAMSALDGAVHVGRPSGQSTKNP